MEAKAIRQAHMKGSATGHLLLRGLRECTRTREQIAACFCQAWAVRRLRTRP
jgi:hypothetical protein